MIAAVVVAAGATVAGLVFVLRSRTSARVASPVTAEAQTAPARTGEPVTATSQTVEPAARPETTPSATAPPAGATPSEPTPAPAPQPAAAQPAVPAAPAPAPLPAPAGGPKAAPGRPAPLPHPEKPSTKPEGAGKGDRKIVLEEEPSNPAAPAAKAEAPSEAPPAPAEPDKPPFDMTAAKAALEGAAASAPACKAADGPTGRGKVQVTFSSSGRVTSANVVEGAFGGTSVGGCVAKLFRAAKVPAFSGDPVTVAKAFTIPE
jgi:hypothetical protein